MHASNDTVTRAARNLCLTLLLAILAGSAAFTGILLSANYERQRRGLNADAKEAALLASLHLDQSIKNLAQTLSLLPWSSLGDANSGKIFAGLAQPITDVTGVRLWARDAKLDVVFRSEPGGDADPASLKSAGLTDIARAAAERAIREKAPQLSAYGASAPAIGEDLWLVAAAPGKEPIVIQARIPASYFSSTLKTFGAQPSWLFAIVRPDGQFLGHLGDEASLGTISFTDQLPTPGGAWAQSLASTSPFGWRVGAATTFATIDATRATNWSWFLLVMALLTALSAAGALSLSRGIASSLEPTRAPPAYPNRLEPAVTGPSAAPHWPTDSDRLRDALVAGSIGTWEYRRGSPMISGDDQAAAVLGLADTGGKRHGVDILRQIDRKDRGHLVTALRTAMTKGHHVAVDAKLARRTGAVRYIAIRGAPFRTNGGSASGISGIIYDLTEQKQTLARTDLLLREVSHRTKNLLALILAMARLTAREDFEAKSFIKHFALRVAGLSVSQDVIVAANWQGADLATLAVAEVHAVARGNADRITISGPSIIVAPDAAQNLGIIITELTLNALEHGALANIHGHVRLSWELPDDAHLRLSWHESGGPHFDPTKPKGYGWTIIERLSVQGLKGTSTVDRDDTGFRWSFEAPLHSIGERPQPHRS